MQIAKSYSINATNTNEIQRTSDSQQHLFALLSSLYETAFTEKDFHHFVGKISDIRERLRKERVHLAVLGQFKRGKSSFLNALLRAPVLPTAVIPLTAVPTYLRYSENRMVKIRFKGGKEQLYSSNSYEELRDYLSSFVSEEKNPENKLNVESVELLLDSPLLDRGVVLIDTPGIGSTHLHNTEATLNFLPLCDAALFLLSPDPPITEAEIVFLKQVMARISKVFFILNKIDYLSPSELDEVIAFISTVLREKVLEGKEAEFFSVSAKYVLNSVQNNDAALLKKSGILNFEERLKWFIAHEKKDVLIDAIKRKTSDILNDMLMQSRLLLKAFKMPEDELNQKLAIFNEKIRQAERQKTLSADMLAGDRKRLMQLLEEQSEQLRKKSRQHLINIMNSFFESGKEVKENEVRAAFSAEIPVFFEKELGSMSIFFDKRVCEIIAFHQNTANEIIDAVRKSASDVFDIPYHAHESSKGLEFVREPYWVLHQWKSSLLPIPEDFIDRLLPKKNREKRIRKRLESQIEGLVLSNVENLRWSTLQNLDMTFRRFVWDVDEEFNEIVEITKQAVNAAVEKRKLYSESVLESVARLENLIERLSQYLEKLQK
ncbi:MAG: dynamin family protein [Spirochaetes bacterium]|nr:dynamin family protein [Spirochaetota bacterium]